LALVDRVTFVQFCIENRAHKKLFRFLDKKAPGWKLSLRPDNTVYQIICDLYDLEDESGFDKLVPLIKTIRWDDLDILVDAKKMISYPVIYMTHEQSVIVKMFWDGWCELYDPNVRG